MAIVRKGRRRRKARGSRKDLDIAKSPDCSRADTLKASAVSYFLKGGYSCFLELGVMSRGTRRADMLGLNLRRQIVICEIKSSVRDYRTDTKWREYLDYCHRMYFVMCPKTFEKLEPRLRVDLKGTGVGVMVLNPKTGYLECVKGCKVREMDEELEMNLITRMAWRGGISKRTNRRTRHYIHEGTPDDGQEGQQEPEQKAKRAVRVNAGTTGRRIRNPERLDSSVPVGTSARNSVGSRPARRKRKRDEEI